MREIETQDVKVRVFEAPTKKDPKRNYRACSVRIVDIDGTVFDSGLIFPKASINWEDVPSYSKG